jgi:collagen type III alpha
MDFLFNLPDIDYRNQAFYTSGVWRKPPNISMVSFFLVGAGGAGGNGFVTSLLQGSGAGAGGGGGAITKLIIPSVLLPDILLVNIGVGGRRGAFQTGVIVSGGSGTATYVDLINGNATASTLIAIANGGGGGGGGTIGGGAGTGGAAGAASTITSTVYLGMGISSFYAGQNGQGGSGLGIITPVSTGTNLTSGGAGGAARSSAGARGTPGSIQGNDVYLPTLSISNSATTYNGQDGVNCISPFQSYGGVGGWPATLTASECGGNGGNGILGSGGGGGGAGNTGCPGGGFGGNGGNGYALITCY